MGGEGRGGRGCGNRRAGAGPFAARHRGFEIRAQRGQTGRASGRRRGRQRGSGAALGRGLPAARPPWRGSRCLAARGLGPGASRAQPPRGGLGSPGSTPRSATARTARGVRGPPAPGAPSQAEEFGPCSTSSLAPAPSGADATLMGYLAVGGSSDLVRWQPYLGGGTVLVQ